MIHFIGSKIWKELGGESKLEFDYPVSNITSISCMRNPHSNNEPEVFTYRAAGDPGTFHGRLKGKGTVQGGPHRSSISAN